MGKTSQLYGENTGYRVVSKTKEDEEFWIVRGKNDLMEIESADEAVRYINELKGDN